MNILLLLSTLIMVFCSFLSNKLKRKSFTNLSEKEQELILAAGKQKKYNLFIFLFLILFCIGYMLLPISKLFSPFYLFLMVMFIYIITNMIMKIKKMQQLGINKDFILTSFKANIIVLIGLSVFAFAFLYCNYNWS
jgi:Flp pilus assembly protein TadB